MLGARPIGITMCCSYRMQPHAPKRATVPSLHCLAGLHAL